jgi:hypothetical protein
MSARIGSANTVQELIDLLTGLPPDKPVRVLSLTHEFPPDVREHEGCITIEP